MTVCLLPNIYPHAKLECPVSSADLDAINAYLSDLPPEGILEWGVAHLPDLYQTTAFGLTGLTAIDMLHQSKSAQKIRKSPPLIFIDTLYHFPETYELVEEVRLRYPDVPLRIYKPDGCADVQEFEARYGERLWETDEALYDYVVKVEPARRAYAELCVKSVITGRRASQGGERASMRPLEIDSTGLFKLNPLFAWNFSFVEWYTNFYNVPCNKLLAKGYRSVGDWHSTAPSTGDNERAGRWMGREKTECGLHKDYYEVKQSARVTSPSRVAVC
ncbi:phosophoadenylyl-sulfate reductase [Fistulina hepatica ATCC 64428]|uniref:Phosophoadenylyl-sulfate reductase n=1 Tax=Fistulina hepatica ATCC 64428 TaxID=1128425 RepID=A0A0D7AND2_9AGAR|nr:phosophoadenylyl-sulfate reductase [Fistulina hepatica ATCC 64428]